MASIATRRQANCYTSSETAITSKQIDRERLAGRRADRQTDRHGHAISTFGAQAQLHRDYKPLAAPGLQTDQELIDSSVKVNGWITL